MSIKPKNKKKTNIKKKQTLKKKDKKISFFKEYKIEEISLYCECGHKVDQDGSSCSRFPGCLDGIFYP